MKGHAERSQWGTREKIGRESVTSVSSVILVLLRREKRGFGTFSSRECIPMFHTGVCEANTCKPSNKEEQQADHEDERNECSTSSKKQKKKKKKMMMMMVKK